MRFNLLWRFVDFTFRLAEIQGAASSIQCALNVVEKKTVLTKTLSKLLLHFGVILLSNLYYSFGEKLLYRS